MEANTQHADKNKSVIVFGEYFSYTLSVFILVFLTISMQLQYFKLSYMPKTSDQLKVGLISQGN